MWLNFNLVALIVGASAILMVGAVAWRRNFHSQGVRWFFIGTITYAFWLAVNYFSLQQYSHDLVDIFVRLTYVGGVWLLTATWYFCYSFPIERRPGLRTRAVLVATLLGGSALGYSRLVVDHISFEGDKVIISPGAGYAIYGLILASLVVAMLVNLRRNYANSDLIQRNQIRYVAFGVGAGCTVSIIFDVLLVLIDPRFGSSLVNLLVVLAAVMFLGYGFIRHRYTDVHRLAAWIFTGAISFGLLSWLLVVTNAALVRLYPYSIDEQRIGIVVVSGFAIFLIEPVRRWLKLQADQLFNVGWYDSQSLLNSMGTMIAGELRLSPLLKNSLDYICSELQVVAGEFIVIHDGKERTEAFGDWVAKQPEVQLHDLPKTEGVVIVDELSAADPAGVALAKQGIRVSMPLLTRGRLVGYLLLGLKRRGDVFSGQDIAVLQILASQLAVAVVSVQAYEEISQFNATLQQQVAEATSSLREAHEKLQIDDRMKTEFIILTSHNLRTPLSIVKGYISLLEESKLNEAQLKLLDSMKAGADRLSQFAEDLLAIDSIVAGNQIELKPTDVTDILEPLIKEFKSLANAKNLAFNTNIMLKNVTINADTRRLGTAIRNLLSNALKFTDQGSISLSADQQDNQINIIVEDTGIGIDPAELPRLFSRFHRATSTMEYNYEGVGIGLYLTDLVVKEHRGKISVTSHLHQGSRFVITLPIENASR